MDNYNHANKANKNGKRPIDQSATGCIVKIRTSAQKVWGCWVGTFEKSEKFATNAPNNSKTTSTREGKETRAYEKRIEKMFGKR